MSGVDRLAATGFGQRVSDPQRGSDFQATLLGMAGHDLRQPLQVMQSAFEWLGARVGCPTDQKRLQRGERALVRLSEQLDGLISAMRLYEQTKDIELSPVSLSTLLWQIERDNQDCAWEKGVEMRVRPTSAKVMSHPIVLDGILRNLVRNAVKFTEHGGRILMGCRRSGGNIRIDVYDTGIGIAPENLERIFEAFQRLDSSRADGLGLGLFVVRRAVDLLGHRIEVSSVASRGSRFSVLAPVVV